MTTRPPNFLFIITDQHRADHLGCYGNPIVRTPHIDTLARDGVRFARSYVANPICMPNRASFMTGRLPSLHGVRHNGIELSLDETTFVEVLRESGYRTALVGKSHLQNITGLPPQWPASVAERFPREARRRTGRYGQEREPVWEADPSHDIACPYYGFEQVQLTIHHGDQQHGHWRRWLRAQVPDAERLLGPENALPAPGLALAACKQAWRTRLPEELYPNTWITDRTIETIRGFAAEGKPFFVQCSYPDPHHPFTPPGRYWSMYSAADVPVPRSFGAPHRNLPPHVQWLYAQRESGKAVKHTQMLFACTEQEAREAIALNYGTISQIDDGVGRLLATLAELGIAGDTVVIFTSDHGDFLGDHQLMLKGPVHYEGLIRVALLWRDPAFGARPATDALVQTTDLAPTILARAGVPAFNGISGRSLLPVLSGAGGPWRDELLIEEEGQRVYLGFDRPVRMRTLLTDRHRLSVYAGVPWGELYDRRDDPLELDNRWDDPGLAGVRGELTERLARAMIAAAEQSPYPTQIA